MGQGSKLYLSNMQPMLNKVLTRFMQILSQESERKTILTWCYIFNLKLKILRKKVSKFNVDFKTKEEFGAQSVLMAEYKEFPTV